MPNYTSKKDLVVGKKFKKIIEELFPGQSRQSIADAMGVLNEARIRLYENGSIPEPSVLGYLDRQGYSIEWLLLNKGGMKLSNPIANPKAQPTIEVADTNPLTPGAIRMKTSGVAWPSPESRAAADTSDRTQTETVDGMAEPILPPEDTVLIPVRGRSMEPVLLDKQYAVVDWQDGGFKGDGGIYVVEVIDGEGATPEIFVKHCFRHGDEYVLQSVNPEVEDRIFPVKHVNRMWQVIGTWYMGKGKPAVFRAVRPRSQPQQYPAYPSVTNPNVVRVLDPEPVNLIFLLQEAFANIGKHVAFGKTLATYPEKNALKEITLRILERIEGDAPPNETPDQERVEGQESDLIHPEMNHHGNTA